jgi:anaerobic dimethyl sulfoxide reductase subunit C (anchor subunit)
VNIHELPMIVFTVLAQMSVGAFVVLGVVQVFASRRYGREAVDRVTDPALYAIGPTLVLGLVASMFHMNDVMNTLNVIRHVQSSWLSREIVSGVAFAGLGFLFALAQWFRWGTTRLRQIVAAVTAVTGLVLVLSMSMIYYSLPTVPAWNTWATPAQFYVTTFLLGSLAVGAAFMGTVLWRTRAAARSGGSYEADAPTRELLSTSLRGVGIAAVALLGVEFLIIPLHLTGLSAAGGVAAESATVFSGGWFVARLVLVFLGAGLLSVFLVRRATPSSRAVPLAALSATALVLVLGGELIGRSLFYDSMIRIGM